MHDASYTKRNRRRQNMQHCVDYRGHQRAPAYQQGPGRTTCLGEHAPEAWEDKPSGASLYNFEHDATTALATFWARSGHGVLGNPGKPDRGVGDCIGKPLSQAEYCAMLGKALKAQHPYNQRIVGCAACGERAVGYPDEHFFLVPVGDAALQIACAMSHALRDRAATYAALADSGDLPPGAKDLIPQYTVPTSGVQLSLYPEFVHTGSSGGGGASAALPAPTPHAVLCLRCNDFIKNRKTAARLAGAAGEGECGGSEHEEDVGEEGGTSEGGPSHGHADSCRNKLAPPYSLASGMCFGNWRALGLTQPTLYEQCVLARTRLVGGGCYIKVVARDGTSGADAAPHVKGHIAVVLHDSVDRFVNTLPNLGAVDTVVVWFVGTKENYDKLVRSNKLGKFLKIVLKVRAHSTLACHKVSLPDTALSPPPLTFAGSRGGGVPVVASTVSRAPALQGRPCGAVPCHRGPTGGPA